jgi:hypothetical protein
MLGNPPQQAGILRDEVLLFLERRSALADNVSYIEGRTEASDLFVATVE